MNSGAGAEKSNGANGVQDCSQGGGIGTTTLQIRKKKEYTSDMACLCHDSSVVACIPYRAST
jgi:hypothetical protein